MGLADAGRPEQQDVFLAGEEGQGGQSQQPGESQPVQMGDDAIEGGLAHRAPPIAAA